MLSKCFVACNIYISAGLPRYGQVLVKLLEDAQRLCALTNKNEKQQVTIVHAFSDPSYDRSSFHIAGSPVAVTSIASSIASNALQSIAPLKHQQLQSNLEHPTVGLVDHISVLPLENHNDYQLMTLEEWQELAAEFNLEKSNDFPAVSLPSGWVARTIGQNLKSAFSVDVLFYGHAHSKGKPLATVRRESTPFFRSLPDINGAASDFGKCIIGAPPEFVENYNIRSTKDFPKQTALLMTRFIRERDGGLPFVEALTLPYKQNRYEVACNLLNPKVTSSKAVDDRVLKFFSQNKSDSRSWVEASYLVGTTEEQCLRVLEQTNNNSSAQEEIDQRVLRQFKACFDDGE
jgi:glutamate formiminotransferase